MLHICLPLLGKLEKNNRKDNLGYGRYRETKKIWLASKTCHSYYSTGFLSATFVFKRFEAALVSSFSTKIDFLNLFSCIVEISAYVIVLWRWCFEQFYRISFELVIWSLNFAPGNIFNISHSGCIRDKLERIAEKNDTSFRCGSLRSSRDQLLQVVKTNYIIIEWQNISFFNRVILFYFWFII